LWLLRGWRLLRRQPRPMISVTLAYFSLAMLINLIPFVGIFLLPLAIPLLTALLGNAYRALDHDARLSPELLLDGLREQRANLFKLGGMHLLGSLLLFGVSMALLGINPRQPATVEQATALLGPMSVFALCATPLLMAFWFAPLLTAWAGLPAIKSLFFSLVACWRNWRAFSVYGLAIIAIGMLLGLLLGALLALAAMISATLMQALSFIPPVLLMMLLGPVLTSGIYISYSDVFDTAKPTVETPDA
jgi:hypothetical protein